MLAPELGADMRRREFITLIGDASSADIIGFFDQLSS
jgi:hypothetical protein